MGCTFARDCKCEQCSSIRDPLIVEIRRLKSALADAESKVGLTEAPALIEMIDQRDMVMQCRDCGALHTAGTLLMASRTMMDIRCHDCWTLGWQKKSK